jgi:hypothetical protein
MKLTLGEVILFAFWLWLDQSDYRDATVVRISLVA